MNILLFQSQEAKTGHLFLHANDPRFDHVKNTLKLNRGDSLQLGMINGCVGTGQITQFEEDKLTIQFELSKSPPPPLPVQLILALPRPKVVGRIMKIIGEMGVKKVYLIQAAKVEKYYWDAHQLTMDYLTQKVIDGLIQTRDTVLPKIYVKKLFRPFVEDDLPIIIKSTQNWVAHPYATSSLPLKFEVPTTIAVGPEGGWVDFELQMFQKIGFQIAGFGTRTMSTATFLPALLGRGVLIP